MWPPSSFYCKAAVTTQDKARMVNLSLRRLSSLGVLVAAVLASSERRCEEILLAEIEACGYILPRRCFSDVRDFVDSTARQEPCLFDARVLYNDCMRTAFCTGRVWLPQ